MKSEGNFGLGLRKCPCTIHVTSAVAGALVCEGADEGYVSGHDPLSPSQYAKTPKVQANVIAAPLQKPHLSN